MVVDPNLVRRKLADLDRHLGELAEYRTLSVDDWRSDWKVQRIVERTLQILVEICIDVAAHLIAEGGLRVGQSAADSFRSLSEAGVVSAALGGRLVRMVGFRNVVVLAYDAVDPVVVVGVLGRHLGDFSDFRDAVLAYLDQEAPA